MRFNLFYILTFVTVLLTSCDFFNSVVPYKGTEEDPQMVVNALLNVQDTPRIYVSRSFFFMDPSRYIKVPDGRYYSGYQYLGVHNGNLKDASVSLTVNSRTPSTLHYFCIRETSANEDELGYYTTDDLNIRPGDTVAVQVSHPIYGVVSATQICPDTIHVDVSSVEMNNYAEAKIKLHITPYHGNKDDVVYLTGNMALVGRFSYQWLDSTSVNEIGNDSYITYLYAYDKHFMDLNAYNSDYGYCAGQCLMLPASAVEHGLDIELIADVHAVYAYNDVDLECDLDTVRLTVTAMAATNDYYMYTQSLKASSGMTGTYVPKLSSVPYVDNAAGALIEEITDVFSELGVQEGIQIQCNVRGGLGHFCLSTVDSAFYEKISH